MVLQLSLIVSIITAALFVLIPATPEDISFPATTASITLITVSWS